MMLKFFSILLYIEMSINNYFDYWYENYYNDNSDEALDFVAKYGYQIWRDMSTSRHTVKIKVKPSEYKYLITFTLDPKKVDLSNVKTKDKIEKYIVNLLKTTDNFRFYYVREHDDTNTHWHCIVHRTLPMKQDVLAYYKKKYGNIDVSRSKRLADEDSMKYLGKESKIVTIK